jgi:hypothetical protein
VVDAATNVITTMRTSVSLHRNGVSLATGTTANDLSPAQFVEDAADNLAYIGCEDNSAATQPVKSNFFRGFIYQYALANYVVTDLTTLFAKSCDAENENCKYCGSSDACPLPTCGIE